MKKISNKFIYTVGSSLALSLLACAAAFAEECNEQTMDAFAYEDCLAANGITAGTDAAASSANGPRLTVLGTKPFSYNTLGRDAYLTSSFG